MCFLLLTYIKSKFNNSPYQILSVCIYNKIGMNYQFRQDEKIKIKPA